MKCVKCGGEVLNGICENCSTTPSVKSQSSFTKTLKTPINNPLLIVIILLLISVVCTLGGVYLKWYSPKKEVVLNKIYIYDEEVTMSNDSTKTLLGTYSCKTENCSYYNAIPVDKANYLIVINDGQLNIYNYKTSTIVLNDIEKIIPFKEVENDYYVVVKNNLYGVVDNTGKQVVDFIYESVGIDYSKLENILSPCDNKLLVCDIKDDNLVVSKNGKYGVINYKTSDLVIDFKYDAILINEMLVLDDSSWFVIDEDGERKSTGFNNIIASYDNLIITEVDGNINFVNDEGIRISDDSIPFTDIYVKNAIEPLIESWPVINKENTIAISLLKIGESGTKEKDIYHFDYANKSLSFIVTTTD